MLGSTPRRQLLTQIFLYEIGNFPGSAPVIYTGTSVAEAIDAGVTAVVVSPGDDDVYNLADDDSVDVIYKVASKADVERVADVSAFLLDTTALGEETESVLEVIPEKSIVIASVESMQSKNAEMEESKRLKALGVTAVLLNAAVVDDAEDLEYADFAISGLTKKKSSTRGAEKY